jgi:hypothetical protein
MVGTCEYAAQSGPTLLVRCWVLHKRWCVVLWLLRTRICEALYAACWNQSLTAPADTGSLSGSMVNWTSLLRPSVSTNNAMRTVLRAEQGMRCDVRSFVTVLLGADLPYYPLFPEFTL